MTFTSFSRFYRQNLEELCSGFPLRYWDIDESILNKTHKLTDLYIPRYLTAAEGVSEPLNICWNTWHRLYHIFSCMPNVTFFQNTLEPECDSLSLDQQLEHFISYLEQELALRPQTALSHLLSVDKLIRHAEYSEGLTEEDPGIPDEFTNFASDEFQRPSPFDPRYTNQEVLDLLKGSIQRPIGPILAGLPSRKLILSEPGGGKTTYLKRIALAYATDDRSFIKRKQLPDELFPVLLDCEVWSPCLATEKSDFLALAASILKRMFDHDPCDIEMLYDMLFRHLQEDNVLLLIDNLESITDPESQRLFSNCLVDFLFCNKNVHVLIAANRETFAKQNSTNRSQFQDMLQIPFLCSHNFMPLKPSEIEAFVYNWYQNLFSHDPDHFKTAEYIVKQLRTPALSYLKPMTGSPLHLIRLLVSAANTHCIPYDKRKVYDDYINLVLERRSSKCICDSHLKYILAYLASYMQRIGMPEIGQDELIHLLDHLLHYHKDLGERYEVSMIKEELEQCPDLLRKQYHMWGAKYPSWCTYHFTSQEIQNYLTAYAYAEQCTYAYSGKPWSPSDLSDMLLDYSRYSMWHDILTFYVLQLNFRRNIQERNNFVSSIIEYTEEADYPSSRNLLLLKLIASGVPMKATKKHLICTQFFASGLTAKKLDTFISFLSDPRSDSCAEYLMNAFEETRGDELYALAAAVLTSGNCMKENRSVLLEAQRLLDSKTTTDRVLGLNLLALLGWCSYNPVHTEELKIEIKLSESVLLYLKNCIIFREVYLPHAAKAIKELLLATKEYDAYFQDVSFVRSLFHMLEDAHLCPYAEEILSALPLSTHYSDAQKLPNASLKEKYYLQYSEAKQHARTIKQAVFLFSICAILGCWNDSYFLLLMEFTELESKFQIYASYDASKNKIPLSPFPVIYNNEEERLLQEDELSAHLVYRRRLESLQNQIYEMTP